MVKKNRTGPTAERFVEATLSLIAQRGGSQGVNLREISRHVGCAHTNAYNYYASFQDLLWAAFRRALRIYGENLVSGLSDSLPPQAYLRRLVSNLATFPQNHPGLYRFIGSDPIDPDQIPEDILQAVSQMKQWLLDVFEVLCGARGNAEGAEEACNILLAYVDGETFNVINGRIVPGEDVRGRIVGNALRLFRLLTGADGARPEPRGGHRDPTAYPRLVLPQAQTPGGS